MAELVAHPSQAPVVISSYVSEKQITAALLEGGIAPSRIIPLYSKPPASKAVRVLATAIMLPPRQTPHSTIAPGT